MKEVLIVGSGARDHALAWKARQNPSVGQIYCAPGNPGMAELADCIPIQANEVDRLANFAQEQKIDLTIVGPENPLKEGIVDVFEKRDLAIFGPSQSAAQIETSKVFAKELMKRHNISTADFKVFHISEIKKAHEYVEQHGAPIVVKPDGLAAGKGSIVAESPETAKQAINNILVKKIFPEAGESVVVEDFLEGDEISITAIANGRTFVPFLLSQDHKRAYDGDKGPNTGGMGVYAPLPWVTPEFERELFQVVTQSTLDALAEEGFNFKGVLYSNVMATPKGPMVLEHNARFGDPEAQALFPLLENDLVEVVCLALYGKLKDVILKWSGKFTVCLTLAAPGYPEKPVTGKIIEGIEDVKKMPDVLIFHAGTKLEDGKLVTAGGRVLSIVVVDESLENAVKKVYDAAGKLNFEGGILYRQEIAKRALTC